MFWDKKKKDSDLPDLPPSARVTLPVQRPSAALPTLPFSQEKDMHALPSFPDSPMKKGFSQSAIKDAIDDNSEMDEEMEESRSREIDWAPKITQMPPMQSQLTPKRMMEAKPVYVRLDKFQAAKRTIDEIRSMLEETEMILKKVRDVKVREEQELAAWEKEMQVMRARINNVSTDIFERLEE